MSEAVKALAANIVARRQAGLDPYIVFIGAGASISSGCSSMLSIADGVLQSHDSAQYRRHCLLPLGNIFPRTDLCLSDVIWPFSSTNSTTTSANSCTRNLSHL